MITFAYILHTYRDAAFIYFQFRQNSNRKRKHIEGCERQLLCKKEWIVTFNLRTFLLILYLAIKSITPLIDKIPTLAEILHIQFKCNPKLNKIETNEFLVTQISLIFLFLIKDIIYSVGNIVNSMYLSEGKI